MVVKAVVVVAMVIVVVVLTVSNVRRHSASTDYNYAGLGTKIRS